eukprot:TRINITY_DN1506_c0_g1_i14.p1 TRINITY_DN1506_c0_g1~~TRINITY_DN1506_c0_g1_i14.p1  ORF type:complete len:569 (+),score=38.36 TRINITY_DN1506_c0_g1_i14:210-1916(+)
MTHTSSGIFIFVLTINYLADPTYGQFAETSPWVGGEPIGSDFGGTSPYSVIAGMHGGDSINSDFGSDGYVPEYPNPGIEFGVAPTLHGGDSINSDFGSDGYVPEYSDPGIEDDTPPFDEGLVPITIPPYDYSEDECIQDSSVVQDPTLKAPYTVSFQVQNEHDPNYRTHLCGGVLIADRFVLTAAHCFWNEQIDNHDFRESGDNEGVPSRALYGAIAPLCRHQQGMGVFKVERYFLHPEYRGRTMYGKDIAVVLLNSSSSTYQGPFVDYSSLDTFSNEEETLIGLGWGYVNGYEADTENHPNLFAKTVRALRKVPLKYLECDSIQDLAVPDDQFCATWFIRNRLGEMGDACKGDSGGPILKGYEGSGESPIGVGIVSWGPDECSGQGLPGVYTKVWMYKDWISTTMEKYNQQQLQQQQQSPPPTEDTPVSPPPTEDTPVSPPPRFRRPQRRTPRFRRLHNQQRMMRVRKQINNNLILLVHFCNVVGVLKHVVAQIPVQIRNVQSIEECAFIIMKVRVKVVVKCGVRRLEALVIVDQKFCFLVPIDFCFDLLFRVVCFHIIDKRLEKYE